MPSTARQLRQPPTIEAIGRVPYFADVITFTPFYLQNWVKLTARVYLMLFRLGRV